MKIFKIGMVMATIVFMTVGAANAALINGGFENGLAGWTYDSYWSVVDWNPRSGTNHATTANWPEGWQYIGQNIATTPGQSYTVGFWLSNGDNINDNEFVARWNGVNKITLTNLDYSSPDYTYYGYTAVATGALTAIDFGFAYNAQWFDLDDVSVTQASAVPIPPTVWFLGSGLIGLVGMRRRFMSYLKK